MSKATIRTKYFIGLSTLFGFCFFFSIAALNTVFYLTVVSGLVLLAFSERTERKEILIGIFSNRLFIVVSLWIILLYASALYSSAPEHVAQYAGKYKKYLFLIFIVFIVFYFQKRNIILPNYFMKGFISGAVLLFVLSIFLKLSGMAPDWIKAGYLEADKVTVDYYWMPIGPFIATLLFSVVFAYGVWLITQRKKWFGLILVGIGCVMVFVVLRQRTGYVGFVVIALWLLATLIDSKRIKWTAITLFLLLIGLMLGTENKVSQRTNLAFSEAERCVTTLLHERDDIQNLGQHCATSNGQRLIFIYDALHQIAGSPLYGYGMGGPDLVWVQKGRDGQYYTVRAPNPHNEYLMQGIQLGIVGVLLLMLIYVLAMRDALRIHGSHRYMYSGIILIYIISCLYNSFLLDSSEGLFLILILAVLISYHIPKLTTEHETDYS